MEVVFLKVKPSKNVYLNFDPRTNPKFNVTLAIHPFDPFVKNNKTDNTTNAKTNIKNKYQSMILTMDKSKVSNSKGEVPLMEERLYELLGNDSNVYIPMDF